MKVCRPTCRDTTRAGRCRDRRVGAYGYAVGYVSLFTLVAGLGTSTYLSRAIARDHGLFGPYVWNAVLFKLVLWLVLSGLAIALAVAIGNRGETLAMVVIGCAGMIFYLLNEVFAGALGGMQRMARPAMWMVVQVYFQTVAGIAVLMLGWGVVAYAAVMAFGVVIPTAGTAAMAWPLMRNTASSTSRSGVCWWWEGFRSSRCRSQPDLRHRERADPAQPLRE